MSLDLPQGNVTVGLNGGRDVTPISSTVPGGSRVAYKAIMPGVDLSYDIAGARVKEQLVLASAASPSTFTFVISDRTHLLGKPKQGQGESYSFSRPVADGTYLTLAAPSSWEQRSGPGGEPHPVVSAHQVVKQIKGGYRVTLSVDKGALRT